VVPEVARAEKEVKASKQRLLDLVARASDDATLQSTIASAQLAGLTCVAQDQQFHAETNLVGWRLVFSRG
jgi:hypothetical protein